VVSIDGCIVLAESSTPADAGEALDVLERVFLHLKDAHSLTHRINRITENITAFETSAGNLTEAIDTSLVSLSPDQAAVRLHTQLVENGHAETARREMDSKTRPMRMQLKNVERMLKLLRNLSQS